MLTTRRSSPLGPYTGRNWRKMRWVPAGVTRTSFHCTSVRCCTARSKCRSRSAASSSGKWRWAQATCTGLGLCSSKRVSSGICEALPVRATVAGVVAGSSASGLYAG
nr:hypothetical protein [Tanacetum cinerariifolium]